MRHRDAGPQRNAGRWWTTASAVTLAALIAACRDEGAAGGDGEATDWTGAPLAQGAVFVTGSSTVEPISVLVSELVDEISGGDLAVTVEGPGTGDGFAKFCDGEADIADASRPIKDEEAQNCADAGVDYVELEVAIDGLTVATSRDNDAVECLDVPALYALVGAEAEGFDSWSDAAELAAEVGSRTPLPDEELYIVGPGPESGTYDTFVEFAIADLAEQRHAPETTRPDYVQSANDNIISEGVEASDTSLGWLGYAFYAAERERMKAIAIDAGEGCVAPSPETIADGRYPFSRSLYIYVRTDAVAANPAVASYVDVYLSDSGRASVEEAGFVVLPEERQTAARDAWVAAG